MILIDSVFINNSGGKVLLDLFVREILKTNAKLFFLFDSRCKGEFDFIDDSKCIYLEPSLLKREKFYFYNKDKFSTILCFNNIPPIQKTSARTIVYFHNLLYLESSGLQLSRKYKLRNLYLKTFYKNVNLFVVQTNYVKELLAKELKLKDDKIKVMPIFEEVVVPINNKEREKKSFVFVSDGNSHKNHLNLLKAWEILKEKNQDLELNLTVSKSYPDLLEKINEYKNDGVNIKNHGYLNKSEIQKLYKKSSFLVYPSLIESFGLGIVEAIQHGCQVISSNLPFTKELIGNGKYFFDPNDPKNIANTVLDAINQESENNFLAIQNKTDELIDLLLR